MIVLDTHAWVWWTAESTRLSRRALNAIQHADGLGVCVLRCWEVAMFVAKRRLSFNMPPHQWIALALHRPKVQLLPLSPVIAVKATILPLSMPADPVD